MSDAVQLAREALERWEQWKDNPTLRNLHRREMELAQAVIDLAAEVEALKAPDNLSSLYPLIEALEAVGMGKPGKPNTLTSMVTEVCAELSDVRAKLEAREWPFNHQLSDYGSITINAVLAAHVETIRHQAEELAALRATVTWRQLDYEDGDTWECSGCGGMSVWEDSPEENDLKFCTYCGHPVVFEPYEDPPDEDDEVPPPEVSP